MRRWPFSFVVATAALGCNLYTPVEVVEPLCDESAVVSVGPGTQLLISWTGDCRVSWVRIDSLPWPTAGLVPVAWQRYSTTPFTSPVRVGVDSTSWNREPVHLGRGQLYQACLVDLHAKAPDPLELACTTFTP
jgi:hypothetical protein